MFTRMILLLVLMLHYSTSMVSSAELPKTLVDALENNASHLNPIHVSLIKQSISAHAPSEVFKMIEEPLHRIDLFYQKPMQNEIFRYDNCLYLFFQRPLLEDDKILIQTNEIAITDKYFYFFDKDDNYFNKPSFIKDFSVLPNETRLFYLKTDYFSASGWSMPETNRDWPKPSVASLILSSIKNGGELLSSEDVLLSSAKTVLKVRIKIPTSQKTAAMKLSLEDIRKELEECIDPPKRKEQLYQRVVKSRSLPDMQELTFTLDPEMGYAVTSWEVRYSDKEIVVRYNNSEFVMLPDTNLWLPRKIRVDHFGFDTIPGKYYDAPIFTDEYIVSSLDRFPIPQSQFNLKATVPGTRVIDYTMPEAKYTPSGYISYVVPASLDDLDKVIAFAINKDARSIQRGMTVKYILIFMGIVLIIFSLEYVFNCKTF